MTTWKRSSSAKAEHAISYSQRAAANLRVRSSWKAVCKSDQLTAFGQADIGGRRHDANVAKRPHRQQRAITGDEDAGVAIDGSLEELVVGRIGARPNALVDGHERRETGQVSEEAFAQVAGNVGIELPAAEYVAEFALGGFRHHQLVDLEREADRTPGHRAMAQRKLTRTLVSMTTRSADIEQLGELLLGQASPPGLAAGAFGELKQRVDVSSATGIDRDPHQLIGRGVELRHHTRRQILDPVCLPDDLGHRTRPLAICGRLYQIRLSKARGHPHRNGSGFMERARRARTRSRIGERTNDYLP